MKRYSFLMLLVIPISILAVVNLGDDYIGPGDMGTWRKHTENSSSDEGGGNVSYSSTAYYYNPYIPTRLDSVLFNSHSDGYGGGSRHLYHYNSYPEYEEMIVEHWSYGYDTNDYTLSGTITSRYNLSGNLIEWIDETYSPTRIVYEYDASNNLTSETLYLYSYSYAAPYTIISHAYNPQNRLIHTEWIKQNSVVANRWQSWSNHSLPDSIYLSQTATTPAIKITKHDFATDGNLSVKSEISKYHLSDNSWSRRDYSYSYIASGEMLFPAETITQSGYATSPDAPFTPANTQTVTYTYTNNFHSVYFYDGNHNDYVYTADWLLSSYHIAGGDGIRHRSITWYNYDPSSLQDDLLFPPRLLCFPNPAKESITIKLQSQDRSSIGKVRIFNMRGQLVRSLGLQGQPESIYHWDCRDEKNQSVPSGIYLIKLDTPSGQLTHRISIVR